MSVRRSSPLDLVNLTSLMAVTSGRPQIRVGLIDGPVAIGHPGLSKETVRPLCPTGSLAFPPKNSEALRHGTAVAGILAGHRAADVPGICPECTLLVRSIFADADDSGARMPVAAPDILAQAIVDCVDAGARVLNLSIAMTGVTPLGDRQIEQALDLAARRGTIVVAASGNEGAIRSSVVTRHAATIPVVAYDSEKRPLQLSNFAGSIGRRGVGGPGDDVQSLGLNGCPLTMAGTSAAAPFVTGAIALLWSLFPSATAERIRTAILNSSGLRRTSIIPPLLDAWNAYQLLRLA